MTAWATWVGCSLFFGGMALGLLCMESYSAERADPEFDRAANAAVFDTGWLIASVSVTAGLFLVFDTGTRDILAMLAAAYVLMIAVKRLLRPGN